MAQMGRYCKAYQLKQFRQFPGWSENSKNVRKERKEKNGNEVKVLRELEDGNILYLQENYTVTDGVFVDENMIFDQVTPEWKEFCHDVLTFKIPSHITDKQEILQEPSGTTTSSLETA